MNLQTYFMHKYAFAPRYRGNIPYAMTDGGIIESDPRQRQRTRGPYGIPIGCDTPKTQADLEYEQQRAQQLRQNLESKPGMLGSFARGAYRIKDLFKARPLY